jgi:hypothetical protein
MLVPTLNCRQLHAVVDAQMVMSGLEKSPFYRDQSVFSGLMLTISQWQEQPSLSN